MGRFRLRNGPNRNAEWAVSDCETGRFAKPVGMDEKIERIDKPVWLGYTLYAFVPVCMRCRAAALPAVAPALPVGAPVLPAVAPADAPAAASGR